MPNSLVHRKLTGFAPDLDPTTPGVIVDGNDFVPTMKGMRTLPSLVQLTDSLPGPCLGSAFFEFPNPSATPLSQVIVAGTSGMLHVNIGGMPWISTPLLGAPVSQPWRCAFYQDQIIATQAGNFLRPLVATHASISTLNPATIWSDLSPDAPLSSIVASSDFSIFLMDWNTRDWWSTLNAAIWIPAIETETVTAPLSQTTGGITAAKALRSGMAIYKAVSLFMGQLSGPPFIWSFTEISRQTGAPSQEAVVLAEDVHYFLGPDDFWRFDGFSVSRLPNALREWFFDRVGDVSMVAGRYDQGRSLIFWHYPTQGSTVRNEWVCYNLRTGQWSRGVKDVDCAVGGTITFTADGMAGIVKADDHAVWAYPRNGARTDPGAFLTTGDLGDRHYLYQLSRVRAGYTIRNGSPTMRTLSSYTPGGPYVQSAAMPLSADGWFNCLNTARLQRQRIEADGDCELADLELQVRPAGEV